jgi:hypothetical protein
MPQQPQGPFHAAFLRIVKLRHKKITSFYYALHNDSGRAFAALAP